MIKVFNEMTPERLKKIRNVLVNEIYTNPGIMLNDTIRGDDIADEIDLIEVITDLYEYLHIMVTHRPYNYMFHWANKCGSWVETGGFDKLVNDLRGEENENN